MSEDNVIPLRAPAVELPSDGQPPAEFSTVESIANLTAYCERLDEGITCATNVLINLETRLRRLELLQNAAERAKAKPVILNQEGKRAN